LTPARTLHQAGIERHLAARILAASGDLVGVGQAGIDCTVDGHAALRMRRAAEGRQHGQCQDGLFHRVLRSGLIAVD